MKKLLVIGCSHSEGIYNKKGKTTRGNEWCSVLAKKEKYKLINMSYGGTANDTFLEKILYGVNEFKPDFVIIQMTSFYRQTFGIDTFNPINDRRFLTINLNDNYYVTPNLLDHIKINPGIREKIKLERQWKKIKKQNPNAEKKIFENFLKFWGEIHIASTLHSKIKPYEQIISWQNILEKEKIPFKIITWFEDINPEHDHLKKYINFDNIVPDNIIKTLKNNFDYKKILTDGCHVNDEAHEFIAEYLKEEIKLP